MLSPLIIALDYPSLGEALACAQKLDPTKVRLKVGKQLFTSEGPRVLDALHALGFDVFLDLKFHDIPNTVAGAVGAAADLGVWMVNVHASGGRRMMEAAATAVAQRSNSRTQLIAVTVLTSMDETDLLELGISETPAERVSRLAALAHAVNAVWARLFAHHARYSPSRRRCWRSAACRDPMGCHCRRIYLPRDGSINHGRRQPDGCGRRHHWEAVFIDIDRSSP